MTRAFPSLALALAACMADPAETIDTQAATACAAPVVIAPAAQADVGAALRVRTRVGACTTATKCYLDDQATPVATTGAGALDAPLSVALGAHTVACNGWDSAGSAAVSTTVAFTAVACGPAAILSPAAGETTGTALTLETSAPACLGTTKCYLDGDPTPVATGTPTIKTPLTVAAGAHTLACNSWNGATVYTSTSAHFTAAGSVPACPAAQPITAITGPNTSANAAYDRASFGANFGSPTTISLARTDNTLVIDPTRMDRSENPITPGHVSNVDVHTLVPARPDLRWFGHVTPWFGNGHHVDIGLDNNTTAYVAAMVEDMRRRGFDGLVVDWYGKGSFQDEVTLKIQAYLRSVPGNKLTLIVMIDKGIPDTSASGIASQIAYLRTQYFGDANYERDGGKPILMFFGLDLATLSSIKAADGAGQAWVVQGAKHLGEAWVDQTFDWTHQVTTGPIAGDPYDLDGVADQDDGVAAYYALAAKTPGKHAFGAMEAGFNGTLTASTGWSLGKYLPRGHGACVVQTAARIDAVIPANVTRMQWTTWSDWEEGTQIESGVENDVAVTAALSGATLTWSVAGGTGDETTIDHYEVYASADGTTATDVGAVARGTHAFALAGSCLAHGTAYKVAVVAVGRPMIRDHASAWLPVTVD